MMTPKEHSEFGKGFLTCLSKFMKHLYNEDATVIYYYNQFITKDKGNRNALAEYPENVRHKVAWNENVRVSMKQTHKVRLSRMISMWANGSMDHLYELELPKKFEGTYVDKFVGELEGTVNKMKFDYNYEATYQDFTRLEWLLDQIFMELDRVAYKLEPIDGDWP